VFPLWAVLACSRVNFTFTLPLYWNNVVPLIGLWVGQRSWYGYGLDGPGIESRWGARFSATVQTSPGAVLYTEYRVFPGGKERPGRDADSSPPSSAMVKKG
jgi:hypothetical protein